MCALLKRTKFHKKQCIKELFSFNSSKNRSTTRDARGYENPFGSSAPRGMRGQACVKYTKKHPDGRSQALCFVEEPDHIISGPHQERRRLYPDIMLREDWAYHCL